MSYVGGGGGSVHMYIYIMHPCLVLPVVPPSVPATSPLSFASAEPVSSSLSAAKKQVKWVWPHREKK